MKRLRNILGIMPMLALGVLLIAPVFSRAQQAAQQSSQQTPQQTPQQATPPAEQQAPSLYGPKSAPPAQQKAAPPPQEPTKPAQITVTSSLVVVPVTVKYSSGALANNLLQEEFRVFEDGVEQRISLFSVDPYPISAVVLLDNALGERSSEQVRKSLRAIVGGIASGDEVNVLRFDYYSEDSRGFINDPDKLMTQLSRVDLPGDFEAPAGGPMTLTPMINGAPVAGSPGVTQKRAAPAGAKCINDAVYEAAMLLRPLPRNRRKIIFLISDGLNSKGNKHSFGDTVKMLESSEVSVYSIGVGGAFLDRGVNIISRLAHDSGGDVFYVERESSLESLYSRVADQARNQYTIGYSPSHPSRATSYHSVEVRVRHPGLTVMARRGYYSAVR